MEALGRPVHRLAVVDEGESAVRLLTAVGGLNATGDAPPITTVLFHRDPEPRPWYGREADEVRPLVDASGSSPEPDASLANERVVASLGRAGVDTVWLGASVSNARVELIEACEAAGIAVVGPSAATLRRLDSDVTGGATDRAPTGPVRQVEIDVLADHHGTVWNLGGRDVSVRTRSHTMLAEAPCAAISEEMGQQLRTAATELARSVDLRGAAVITYLHNGVDFALDGVDAAAPPDHATTEERTGASIIGWRLRVHRGEALPPSEPTGDGVVVEARLHAEDFEQADSIASASVALLSFPVGTGVRIDANRRPGDPVTPGDSLLAVVSAWGPDRSVALGRVRRALERTAIVLGGAATNRTTLLELLAHGDFIRGHVDESWAARVLTGRPTSTLEPVALLAAAVESYEADRRQARTAFFAGAARGRPATARRHRRGHRARLCRHLVSPRRAMRRLRPVLRAARLHGGRRVGRRTGCLRATNRLWRPPPSSGDGSNGQRLPGRSWAGPPITSRVTTEQWSVPAGPHWSSRLWSSPATRWLPAIRSPCSSR